MGGTDVLRAFPAFILGSTMSRVLATRPRTQSITPGSGRSKRGTWLDDLPQAATGEAIDRLFAAPEAAAWPSSGRLLVGVGNRSQARTAWLQTTADAWQTRARHSRRRRTPEVIRCDGRHLTKELRRARSSGSITSLQAVLGIEQADLRPSRSRQPRPPKTILIDRIDVAGKREDDHLLLGRLIDAILDTPTLLAVTLPGHPATLCLHPAVESRLAAGLLIPLGYAAEPTQTPPTRPAVNKTASPTRSQIARATPSPTIRRILSTVARYHGITSDDITGGSQRRCHVRPRSLAIHCAHLLTELSSHAIGRAIGGRDHSTVLHSLKVTTKLLRQDAGYAGDLQTILDQLTRHAAGK